MSSSSNAVEHRSVRQLKGGAGGAGLDGRIGGHAVEQLLPLQSLRGDEQPALHADPVAVHPLPRRGRIPPHRCRGCPPGVVVAGAGDLLRVRVQHGLIGGDVLGQIGGAALRRGGEVVGGPLIPVVDGVLADEVVADQTGGEDLTGMGPASVHPGLDGGGTGAPRSRRSLPSAPSNSWWSAPGCG